MGRKGKGVFARRGSSENSILIKPHFGAHSCPIRVSSRLLERGEWMGKGGGREEGTSVANWARARRASLLLEKSRQQFPRYFPSRAFHPFDLPPPPPSNAYKLAPFIITVGTSGMICGPYATPTPESRQPYNSSSPRNHLCDDL